MPTVGHLGAMTCKEITVTFSALDPVKLDKIPITCTLRRITYVLAKDGIEESEGPESLWGVWDDSMKSVRPASTEDLAVITANQMAQAMYEKSISDQTSEKSRTRKSKSVGLPPLKAKLFLGPESSEGVQMVYEIVSEPAVVPVIGVEVQKVLVQCSAVADNARFKCEGNNENINFLPTYMLQSAVHTFRLTNESNVSLPVKWSFEDIKRKPTRQLLTAASRSGARPQARRPSLLSGSSPFSIDPDESEVPPNSTKEFKVTFLPLDAEDFVFLLRGETCAVSGGVVSDGVGITGTGSARMVVRGTAKRPLCHFELVESPDYRARRPPNLKNELGMFSPIEVSDIRIVEVESVGLRTRNTYRFHIINTTNENYDFTWTPSGEPSTYWKCVQSSGILSAGKRIEIIFEYLPEDSFIAESFFKFKLSSGVEQLFLFVGKVTEPKVFFSTSKVDFHSMVLGGEGNSETVYLENSEHLPFQFKFDRSALLQFDGPLGNVIDINPKQGTLLPHGKIPIILTFRPQEEIPYNINILCEIKRKPSKLSLNIKGEGYAVHPTIILYGEDNETSLTLKSSPTVNYIDFGAVQLHDKVTKKLSVTNSGKYNFDYVWNVDQIGTAVTLSGGKMGGTLQKGGNIEYSITFCPSVETALEGCVFSFTIAGKYTYRLAVRGVGVQPALRFSFMQYDFGTCYVTSPGGSTVVETAILKITNQDPVGNIAIECVYLKTRALWVDCPPTMIAPGVVLEVPICFAPRDVTDYAFSVPFLVNGSGKLNVGITGKGALARLDLTNASQRKIMFGVVNLGSETKKIIPLTNKSKKPILVQLIDEGSLADRCITITPSEEITVQPKETLSVHINFNPKKRVGTFSEDLFIKYAGLTRKLLQVSGKAQGAEYALDSDSLPFGSVVEDSQKIKKLSLDNSGDLPIAFQWNENTFGPHFKIVPLSGKVAPGNEAVFDVIFRPSGLDLDVRQDGIQLMVHGLTPLTLTCTGSCIAQPIESAKILQFSSLVRKEEIKFVKLTNPTDKDWHLTPSLKSENWKTPHEIKVPARGGADLPVSYLPLTMCPRPQTPGNNTQRGTGMHEL